MKIVYALLALGLLKCILLYKLYNSVPAVELKRLARDKNRRAASLYKAANYEAALFGLLWMAGTACAAGLLIWSARTNWWLAVIISVITAYLVVCLPAPRWDGPVGAVAALAAKYYAAGLSLLNPVLSRLGGWLAPARAHSRLYEKDDLLELFSRQTKQADNRIAQSDLKIALGAITFGDKTVRSVMTPRRKLRLVKADETVGPMLMDELHKTGHSRFAVTNDNPKSANPSLTGTLYLKDIISMQAGGKVKDYARKDVYYINEDSDLRQALNAFLKTHHHLLIVVNNFEEIVGVLSIEDVFEQIIGQPINDEFDEYDSRHSVANKTENKPAEPVKDN
ncbi:MAG TPA: CBS domain-containing protein [Candidatus Saccharimonadales bacterium]|nr:CBS domain-containing protein [Candidatus Saccharimonadales bacterium]